MIKFMPSWKETTAHKQANIEQSLSFNLIGDAEIFSSLYKFKLDSQSPVL